MVNLLHIQMVNIFDKSNELKKFLISKNRGSFLQFLTPSESFFVLLTWACLTLNLSCTSLPGDPKLLVMSNLPRKLTSKLLCFRGSRRQSKRKQRMSLLLKGQLSERHKFVFLFLRSFILEL